MVCRRGREDVWRGYTECECEPEDPYVQAAVRCGGLFGAVEFPHCDGYEEGWGGVGGGMYDCELVETPGHIRSKS